MSNHSAENAPSSPGRRNFLKLTAGTALVAGVSLAVAKLLGVGKLTMQQADELARSLPILRTELVKAKQEEKPYLEGQYREAFDRLIRDGYSWIIIDLVQNNNLPNEGPLTRSLVQTAAVRFRQDVTIQGFEAEMVHGVSAAYRTNLRDAQGIVAQIKAKAWEIASTIPKPSPSAINDSGFIP